MQLNHASNDRDVSALTAAAWVWAFRYTELDEAIFLRGTKKESQICFFAANIIFMGVSCYFLSMCMIFWEMVIGLRDLDGCKA